MPAENKDSLRAYEHGIPLASKTWVKRSQLGWRKEQQEKLNKERKAVIATNFRGHKLKESDLG